VGESSDSSVPGNRNGRHNLSPSGIAAAPEDKSRFFLSQFHRVTINPLWSLLSH